MTTLIHPPHYYVKYLLRTRPLHDRVLPLRDPVVPPPIIILIDPVNLPILPDLNDHANVAHEVLPARFDGHLAVRADNVVGTPPVPDLLDYGAGNGGEDELCERVS